MTPTLLHTTGKGGFTVYDKSIAVAFNDLRRSTAVAQLAAMIVLEVVTDDELASFSEPTRKSAVTLADLQHS